MNEELKHVITPEGETPADMMILANFLNYPRDQGGYQKSKDGQQLQDKRDKCQPWKIRINSRVAEKAGRQICATINQENVLNRPLCARMRAVVCWKFCKGDKQA